MRLLPLLVMELPGVCCLTSPPLQWVGLFVQFKLKKTRPRTRPEPALPPLIPIGPLGLTGKVGGGHRPGM